MLALGLECGFIEVWIVPTVDLDSNKSKMLLRLPTSYNHVATVTKLAWRPLLVNETQGEAQSYRLTLASCSMDRGCRMFEFQL